VESPSAQPQDAPALQQADAGAAVAGEVSADEAAIRAQSVAFVEAFNQGDAKALAEMWTPDGEYVDDAGRQYAGRGEIEEGYAALFAENPNATLQLTIDSLRMLGSDVAMEDGQAVVELPSGEPPTPSQYVAVHVKVDGRWLMASVRDEHVDSSASDDMADLDWLIGTWVAEEQGVKTESVCRWLGDHSFVERRYRTTGLDGAEAEGVQIIGWNAQDKHVQSWNFSPDGGFAVAVWTPTEEGWRATVQGITSEGAASFAINHLRGLDDNAYVWQSTQRVLEETPLPDSDEIIYRRRGDQ
jgi:uncharacterized protein (TIGR02246 family)